MQTRCDITEPQNDENVEKSPLPGPGPRGQLHGRRLPRGPAAEPTRPQVRLLDSGALLCAHRTTALRRLSLHAGLVAHGHRASAQHPAAERHRGFNGDHRGRLRALPRRRRQRQQQ